MTERGDGPSARRGQADSQPETSAFIRDSGLSVHKKTRPLDTPSVHTPTLLLTHMHAQECMWTGMQHTNTCTLLIAKLSFPRVHTVRTHKAVARLPVSCMLDRFCCLCCFCKFRKSCYFHKHGHTQHTFFTISI